MDFVQAGAGAFRFAVHGVQCLDGGVSNGVAHQGVQLLGVLLQRSKASCACCCWVWEAA